MLFLGKVGSSEADTRIIVWPQVCLECGLKWIALMLLRRRRPDSGHLFLGLSQQVAREGALGN